MRRNIKTINELHKETKEVNISDVNDNNILEIIKRLLSVGNVNKIADIMTDYNSKCSEEYFENANELIGKSKYKEEIESLIRGKLGIFG